MVVVRHAVVYPWAVAAWVSLARTGESATRTGHSSQRIDRTSCSAYYAAVFAPCSSRKSGVRQIAVIP
jgi:hypothetical protein